MTEPTGANARPALVLHAPVDEAFVRGYLLPALGAASGTHREPAIDACDLSTTEIAGLERALETTAVAVAVISPAFLADPWSRLSELLASRAAVERELELIPLVLESCELPLHIREKVSLDFRFRGEWDDQTRRLRDHLVRPPPVDMPLPCPYPGMRPYEAAGAKYFHGRSTEIAAVLALAAAGEREIYLVGPSGGGKSSLIAAGVVPALAAQPGAPELVVRTMRPGDAPVCRLAECLDVALPDAAAIAAWAARHPVARLVIFVDQLEELFALASLAEQAAFAVALRALRAEPRCLLVLAVRADFYAELIESQLWLDGSRRHVDLLPLRGAALRAAIERPARALDVYLERDLVERLLADAAGEPGVLPLLQEALVQLWNRRRRRRLLTLTEYEALGEGGRSGLAVAISSRADRCLRDLTAAQVAIARRLLLRLVCFGDGRPNTRRRQTRAQLATDDAPAELDAVLRHLVAARLITMSGEGSAADDLVDLCHDVLITAWPSFTTWVEARRADELRRRQIQASADEWIARSRGASGLLDEGELAAAIAWRRTDAARELGESAQVTALIDASCAAVTRERRRRRRALASVGAGLVVFAAVTATLAWIAQRRATAAEVERGKAEAARRDTVRTLGEQYREVATQLVERGELQRAIPYLVAARERGVDDVGLRTLFRIATTNTVVLVLEPGAPITSLSFSADGTRIVTGAQDGTARLWDASSGAPLVPPLTHPGRVMSAAVRADGARLLTISDDHVARVWDLTARPPVAIALRHDDQINAAMFSPDGMLVVTASDDHTTRLWSVDTGAQLVQLEHDGRVGGAALNRDGSRIVTTLLDGLGPALWNARTATQVARLQLDPRRSQQPSVHGETSHMLLVLSAAFSPDGTRLATAALDGTLVFRDAMTGKVLGKPVKQPAPIEHVTFDPTGERVATASDDGQVRIWNVTSATLAGPPLVHPSQVLYSEYSRDGGRLFTICNDQHLRFWGAASGTLLSTIDLESGLASAAVSPDGTRVVAASGDGPARVWKVGTLEPRVVDAEANVGWVAYSPDGSQIAMVDRNGVVRVWTASGTRKLDVKAIAGAPLFDPGGRRLAVIRQDGAAQIGPADAPALPIPYRARRDPPGPVEKRDPDEWAQIANITPGAFSPDGKRFATTGERRSARIWDSATGLAVTPRLTHDGPVLSIGFSPDGRRAVTASQDGTARVWNAASGASLGPPLAHPPDVGVTFAVFTPDGRSIVTTAADRNARVWDADSHQRQHTLTGHTAAIVMIDVSPDGALLVTASRDHTARVWSTASGTLAVPPLVHRSMVSEARFSPDGARLLTVSDELVQLWDVRTGRPLGSPFKHPRDVWTARFSPDGSAVVTTDGEVRVWDASVDRGTLDEWRRAASLGPYPQLAAALNRGIVAGDGRDSQ